MGQLRRQVLHHSACAFKKRGRGASAGTMESTVGEAMSGADGGDKAGAQAVSAMPAITANTIHPRFSSLKVLRPLLLENHVSRWRHSHNESALPNAARFRRCG